MTKILVVTNGGLYQSHARTEILMQALRSEIELKNGTQFVSKIWDEKEKVSLFKDGSTIDVVDVKQLKFGSDYDSILLDESLQEIENFESLMKILVSRLSRKVANNFSSENPISIYTLSNGLIERVSIKG